MKQINKILLRLGCMVLGLFYCSEPTLALGERTNSVMAKGILVRQGSASEKKTVKLRNIHVEQQRTARFIPNGYKLIKKIYGDLNKDGYRDCVLLIKATRKDHIKTDSDGNVIDRNRKGLVVLFYKKGTYQLASKNLNFLMPDKGYKDGNPSDSLSVNIRDGKLYIFYNEKDIGDKSFCFRYQGTDLVLIGADFSFTYGEELPLTIESYNFLTRVSSHENQIANFHEDVDATYEWEAGRLKKKPLIKLSEIYALEDLSFETLD